MQNKAYENLAVWFEYLNDDCDYENWSQYLLSKLSAYSLTDGLDIGCGGGWFTRAFSRHGYRMTGVDVSPQMLDFAQAQSMKEGVRAEYLLGDVVKLKTLKKYDFATAINDCINYVPKDKLGSAFKSVKNALKKGGIFLFDISSTKKFREKIANTVSVDDRDDITYVCFNKQEQDGATMDVSLFIRRADGLYERKEETHRQYAYTEEEIITALKENGFTPLQVEGHLGEDKTQADRLCFLAVKE